MVYDGSIPSRPGLNGESWGEGDGWGSPAGFLRLETVGSLGPTCHGFQRGDHPELGRSSVNFFRAEGFSKGIVF